MWGAAWNSSEKGSVDMDFALVLRDEWTCFRFQLSTGIGLILDTAQGEITGEARKIFFLVWECKESQ